MSNLLFGSQRTEDSWCEEGKFDLRNSGMTRFSLRLPISKYPYGYNIYLYCLAEDGSIIRLCYFSKSKLQNFSVWKLIKTESVSLEEMVLTLPDAHNGSEGQNYNYFDTVDFQGEDRTVSLGKCYANTTTSFTLAKFLAALQKRN